MKIKTELGEWLIKGTEALPSDEEPSIEISDEDGKRLLVIEHQFLPNDTEVIIPLELIEQLLMNLGLADEET